MNENIQKLLDCKTEAGVIALLTDEGIKGKVAGLCSCPIANYVKKYIGDEYPYIHANFEGVHNCDSEGYIFKNTKAICDFMVNFDNRHLPQFIA